MATKRITMRLLAGLTLLGGFGLTASAQVPALTVEKALDYKPRQPGVAVTTPAAGDLARFRIDAIPNPKQAGTNMGYILRDPGNRPVRQFVSYDNKQFNIISYYVDGQESYREIDSNLDGIPDQYRWLGANGSKWGVDRDQDGKIDSWAVISPEEASQELLAAIATRDAKKLEALLPTKEELDALGLPAAESARIREKAAGAMKRLPELAATLKLTPNAKWMHLELGAPSVTPADAFGGRDDLVSHKNGTIVIEDNGQTQFIQTGELLLVGRAWKVIEGPSSGPVGNTPSNSIEILSVVKTEVGDLDALDKTAAEAATPEAQVAYNLKRAEILKKIVAKMPPDKQDPWARQLIDCLTAAAEGGKADGKSLTELRDLVGKLPPQTPLAAYAAFRLIVAENSVALNAGGPVDVRPVQDKWRASLEEFVKKYPTAEDAPEAALRLAMAFEFLGKEGEPKAKTWYEYLVKTHAQHPHAAKAAGAVRRLDSEGQRFGLDGSTLQGPPFAMNQLAGKAMVVYYWASWSTNLGDDAQKLKNLLAIYGPKGVELVTVNLDDDAKAATAAAARAGLPGTHLHQPGGLDKSALAAAYGIMVVPHAFVVDKTGKVVNRNAQVGTLEDDLKKVTQ